MTAPLPPAEVRRSIRFGLGLAGAGVLVAALAIYLLGPMEGTLADVAAGFVALGGLTAIVLGLFIWVLPAILPAK